MKFLSNPSLTTCKAGWPGTPVDDNGRFMNLENPLVPRTSDVFKWLLSSNPQAAEKKSDPFRLQHRDDRGFLQHNRDCLVWLGHASFFIRLAGVSMLVDPVFYNQRFLKRYASHAFGAGLFKNLDYLLLSHDHRDHCQERSIRELAAANPAMTVLTGLGMEPLLHPWIGQLPVQSAGWYQQYQTVQGIEIYYLPTRHWGRRLLNDINLRLWGAYIIRSAQKTIYFGADSAYDDHFHEIKSLFQPVDVAILGAGAYKPAWLMQQFHMSPQQAIAAFHDTGAKWLVPMHYGTFDLSNEPVGEPYRILQSEETLGHISGGLRLLDLGENWLI